MSERRVTLGLLAAPGLSRELAQELSDDLPELLAKRFPGLEWHVEVRDEPLAAATAADVDLVQISHRRMLDEGWDLAICLTDNPILLGRRPAAAHASVSLGVGLVSVPALGPVALEQQLRDMVLRLVDRLLGKRESRSGPRRRRRRRRRGYTVAVGSLQNEGETVDFVTPAAPGSLRLLLGMVRDNRPWRLVSGLSRALAASLGFAVFALASPGVWSIANGMGWARPIGLAAGAVLLTCASLVVAHGLWERLPRGRARERVLLFNLATVLTVFIGILTLYLALLVLCVAGGEALIVRGVLERQIHHPAGFAEYLKLALLASVIATIGGALGAALETDRAVREAAYGYHPED